MTKANSMEDNGFEKTVPKVLLYFFFRVFSRSWPIENDFTYLYYTMWFVWKFKRSKKNIIISITPSIKSMLLEQNKNGNILWNLRLFLPRFNLPSYQYRSFPSFEFLLDPSESISVGNFSRAVDRVLRPDDSSPSRGILGEIGDDEEVSSRFVTPLCLGISSISRPIQVQPMNYGHPNEWFY